MQLSSTNSVPSPMSVGTDLVLEPELLLGAYRSMVRARKCDEKTIVLYKQNKCHFQIGVAGHEAVQAAAALAMKASYDWFYPYYRDMGLCTALGMTSQELMMNAMNRADDPNSGGRQMPMHYGHKGLNIVSQSSPTGTQFLQAVGAAMAIKYRGGDQVVYVSAGEGTTSQGDYHEALNWAAREKLPVIFLIQNNGFAISVPIAEQIAGESVVQISSGYEGLEAHAVNGLDFVESYEALDSAVKRARAGEGPTVIEAKVVRLQSHSISDNHLKYRTKEDVEQDKSQDPILLFGRQLIDGEVSTPEELNEVDDTIKREVDEAAEWAEEQPMPEPFTYEDHLVVNRDPGAGVVEEPASGEEMFIVDAINRALHEEMERNPELLVFGQDVAGGKGGVFTVTTGLTSKFGDTRCFNAPLAEASIAGAAIGMATLGIKAVPEIQFGDYVWTAMMQIRNELATMNYRSNGSFTSPVVMRIPVGGYIHGALCHSQNIEATFAHFPGLYIALPSNARDAKGMLKSAIRGDDPVLFLEHKGLYRQVYAKAEVGDENHLVPLGRAAVTREGDDATIVTWGATVQKSLVVAEALAKEGAEVEVLDLRSIVPLDTQTILASVRKTGRLLVVHEDVLFMGFGAEISAIVAEQAFDYLDAPILRVGGKNTPVPHAPVLESMVLPQNDWIEKELRKLLEY